MNSLGRSSALIAGGILASRITGLIRNVVLLAAIGVVGQASDAFSGANQLPNNIYTIISTGLITAVIVPQIVQWSARSDGGRGHISKLLTLGTVVLLIATGVAMLLAGPLISLYANRLTPEAHALAVAFALWCLPQVFFYGLFALLGETLNARRIFGPYAWAPIVNNVVSIAGFLVFIRVFGGDLNQLGDWRAPDGSWHGGMVGLLGGVATAGIIAQTIVLAIFWRRTGLSLRPDFRWRGIGLSSVARLAGWTFLMTAVGQGVAMLQGIPVSAASGDASITVWQNAWLVFMLPYSVIVLSIGTPYFTQLSEHASAGRTDAVKSDVARAMRILGMLCTAATVALIVGSVPAIRIFASNADTALSAAPVLIAFVIALVPMAVLFVIQRTFYAYGDTRTPFFFTLAQGAIAGSLALVAYQLLRTDELIGWLTAAVALGQTISSIVQLAVAQHLLKKRIGSFDMNGSVRALGRFAAAAVPAAAAGWGVLLLAGGSDGWMVSGRLQAFGGLAVIGLVVVVVYAAALFIMRAPELAAATTLVRRIIRR